MRGKGAPGLPAAEELLTFVQNSVIVLNQDLSGRSIVNRGHAMRGLIPEPSTGKAGPGSVNVTNFAIPPNMPCVKN